MLQAYRLVYDFSNFGSPQLWEWQQPYIDHLVLNARTFGRRVVGWYFEDWDALDQDNTRIRELGSGLLLMHQCQYRLNFGSCQYFVMQ